MEMQGRKKSGIFTLIDFAKSEGREYALLCLQFERAVRYALYIEDGEEIALELIGSQRKEAQKIFEAAVRGTLSPIHLREVAFDRNAEETLMEIFC